MKVHSDHYITDGVHKGERYIVYEKECAKCGVRVLTDDKSDKKVYCPEHYK